tara:strand:- start:1810 stop:2094 length:285 start_codon:yes stop_codon:yes gene_type:complete
VQGVVVRYILAVVSFLSGYANAKDGLLEGASNVVSFAGNAVNAISFICAIFFLFSGIYHYSLYRKNPVGVRLSSPVVMILCAIVLVLYPYLSSH